MLTENISDYQTQRMDTLLRCSDVAHILNISRSKAYLLVQSGEIPSVHIGVIVRVQLSDLKAFIAEKVSINSMSQLP